jgi:glycine hydroxymethyltransferase
MNDLSPTMLVPQGFWNAGLSRQDPDLAAALNQELTRQQSQIELIASENIVSQAVLEAQGSVLTNKYAEGYPGRRYYGGCEFADEVEALALERVKALFGASYANVQPHSGAQANQAVMLALLQPGDSYMGMSLAHGGHLSHGAPPNLSGKWFKAIGYGVRKSDQYLDYDALERTAEQQKPKVIIAGGSAYPRIIDFARIGQIAQAVGAIFWVDMAHFAGLVAGGVHPNPLDYAQIVTSTTHKTLRSARGGVILSRDEALGKRLNSAVFPGLQGGPLMHAIAGKAVGFGEALQPSFKRYTRQVVENAKALGEVLVSAGLALTTGGTDTHLVVVDLRAKGVKGNKAEQALERAGITCNKNAVPFDPESPFVTSGIRLGTPAGTTRGFGVAEFQQVGEWIARVIQSLAENPDGNDALEREVRREVEALCRRFPIYPELG